MSRMIFEWKEDNNGNTGWLAKGFPNFDVIGAGQFAHDCMEHFPRGQKHGPQADELLALGARLHIRVASGWWWSQRYQTTPTQSFAYELELLLRNMRDCGQAAAPVFPEPLLDDDMDAEIEAIIKEAVVVANRELNYQLDDGEEAELYTVESELMQNMAAWMRRGVRACIARYKGAEPWDIMHVGETLDAEMKKYTHGEDGDTLEVRIHEKDMEFQIRHKSLYQ